jgi:alkanesulfonate monooxygenase SsuD/methylene tetrahydromethanopterin reductase-like flavin-dependent oxidoreductase (luciferase family)
MKYGLQVITAWSEEGQGVENCARFLVELIAEADKAGWDGVFLWDHLFFPWVTPIAEPWTALAAASRLTERIRLGTNVTPLPRRMPQTLAKQLSTLDHLSGGRVILGAGLGGSGEGGDAGPEFSGFGMPSDYRTLGEMTDEALEVVAALWSGDQVDYAGRHYMVKGITFQPAPLQRPRIPVWVGGSSPGALRRAARWDGWVPAGPAPSAGFPGLSLDDIEDRLNVIRGLRTSAEPLDVCYGLEWPDDGKGLSTLVDGAASVGVTWLLDCVFGLKYSGEQALHRVREGPPDL